MKKLFISIIIYMCSQTMMAQHQPTFDHYRQETGDYAALFQGKIERGYSSTEYANHPYWTDGSFQSGEVLYRGLLYTNLSLRYDAFLHQLIVNTPVKKANVWVDMSVVDHFMLGPVKFIRQGEEFVALHYDSPRMKLIQKKQYTLGVPVVKNHVSYKNFKESSQYLLQLNGQSHEVSSLASVLKHFPDHKKQLKQFAKGKRLNFKAERTSALTVLINYADQITNLKP